MTHDGGVAQLAEQLTLNQRVVGSSPSTSTMLRPAGYAWQASLQVQHH